MPKASSFRVRFALVGIFSALALAFVMSTGRAQPPGPGMPVIPTMPGGAGAFGGGPPNFGGGIHGNPNGSNGGASGGMPKSSLGGSRLSGLKTYSWRCGGCGMSLGTSHSSLGSGHIRCPRCNATFVGTKSSSGSSIVGSSARPTNPPVGGNVASPTSAIFHEGDGPDEPIGPAPTNPTPSTTDNSSGPSNDSSSSRGRSKTFVYVGIGIGAIILIGAFVAIALVVVNASTSKPVRLKRRKAFED